MKKIFSKFFQFFIVLFGISFFSFSLIYLSPGDAAEIMLTDCGIIPTPELLAHTRAELGLDKPFLFQYWHWLSSVIRLDFGTSYSMKMPVLEKLAQSFLPTLQLSLLSLFFMLIISFPLGILAAVKKDKWQDYMVRGLTFFGISIPNFWLSLIFLSFFGVYLKWVKVAGGTKDFSSMILPALTLSIAMSSKYIRQIRILVIEEMEKPYVFGARMRGMSERFILWKEVVPNVMIPLITLLGLSLGSLLGGTAVVEIVYNFPGLGNTAIKAISMRDFPLIQSYVLLVALIYLIINTIVDISYKKFDNRVSDIDNIVNEVVY